MWFHYHLPPKHATELNYVWSHSPSPARFLIRGPKGGALRRLLPPAALMRGLPMVKGERPDRASVPTIDTFGCARFHPFGNGKPQKRAGPATRERRKPWRRQAPPFPESVIHRELAFQAQIPRQRRQRVLVLSCAINRYKGRRVRARGLQRPVGRVPSRGDDR